MDMQLRDQEQRIKQLLLELEQLKSSQHHWVADRAALEACQASLCQAKKDATEFLTECKDLRASLASSQLTHGEVLAKYTQQQDLFEQTKEALLRQQIENKELSAAIKLCQADLDEVTQASNSDRQVAANKIEVLQTTVNTLSCTLVQREADINELSFVLQATKKEHVLLQEAHSRLTAEAQQWVEERLSWLHAQKDYEEQLLKLNALRVQDQQLDREARARIEEMFHNTLQALRVSFTEETALREAAHKQEIDDLMAHHAAQIQRLQSSVQPSQSAPLAVVTHESPQQLRLPSQTEFEAHALAVKSLSSVCVQQKSPRKLKMKGLFLRDDVAPASRKLVFGQGDRMPVRMARVGLACFLNPEDPNSLLFRHGIIDRRDLRRLSYDGVN
jgi:hypothetical protein